MDVRNEVEVFISTAVDLSRQVQLFEELFLDQNNLESLNRFPSSFEIMRKALLKSIVISVCAFFDPQKSRSEENLSIEFIKDKYRGRFGSETPGLFAEAYEIYDRLNIARFRSKYLAHHDLKHFTKTEKISQEIETEDLQRLSIVLIKIGLTIEDDRGRSSVDAEGIFQNSRLRPFDCGHAVAQAVAEK